MGKWVLVLTVWGLFLTAHASDLNERLKQQSAKDKLFEITKAPETFNKVTLLHLGKNSLPVRQSMIENAKQYIFISVPFWAADEQGLGILRSVLQKSYENDQFDYRVIQDWSSQFISFHGGEIENALKDHRVGWKSPFWMRRFTPQLWHKNVHDKFFIVDGEKMVVGGMNIANEYLLGGKDVKGWHDTDILVEGPAVQEGAKIFVKLWQLSKYLESDQPFPPFNDQELRALQEYFYEDKEDLSYEVMNPELKQPLMLKVPVHIGFKDILNDPKYFPPLKVSPEFKTSVRIIYDNPLIDREVKTYKTVSKIYRTVQYLIKEAKESAWFFMPYFTVSEENMATLTEAAKRIQVRVITNSYASDDFRDKAYVQQASHYQALIDAGVELYEWQGHKELIAFQKANGCTIDSQDWPGDTLHSKIALFDGSVSMIGSSNMNKRSNSENNEQMSLINDADFSAQVKNIFLSDLQYLKGARIPAVTCGEKTFSRPPRLERIDQKRLDELKIEYKIPGVPVWSYPIGA